MKYLAILLVLISSNAAMAANCQIKGVMDEKDGAIYYNKDHRLHKHVKINQSKGDKTFCSEREAEKAGFDEAPEYFSNSTARLVECVEKGVKSCMGYVIGQYRSLNIYGKACGNPSQSQIVTSFLDNAKTTQNRLDVERFYGTTGALIDAFPCDGKAVARR